MSRFTPTTIVSEYAAITAMNTNFSQIATILDDLLSRSGSGTNTMTAKLDMNHFSVQNLGTPVNPNDAARLIDITTSKPVGTSVSLREFGAKLDSVTDDLGAWAALFAAYPAGEVKVRIDGYCKVTNTITPPAGMSNVTLDFEGGGYIYNPNHNFDFLHLPNTVAGWRLNNPKFFSDNGGTGGGGNYCLRNDSNDLMVRDFWARNCWHGFFNSGAKVTLAGRTYVNNIKVGAGAAVVVDMGTNEVFHLEDLYAENAVGQDSLEGVLVLSGGSIIIGGIAARCGTPLLVQPTAGKIVATLGLWPFFNGDSSSGNGARFTATGGGLIERVEGVLRVSSNAGNGLLVDVAPQSVDLQVRAVKNATHGVDLSSGGTQYNSRYRVMTFGNTLSGVNVDNNASNFSLDVVGGSGDNFGGNGQYSVALGTGCDHFDVRVVGAGDTLGQLFNGSGTSATKVITARN